MKRKYEILNQSILSMNKEHEHLIVELNKLDSEDYKEKSLIFSKLHLNYQRSMKLKELVNNLKRMKK